MTAHHSLKALLFTAPGCPHCAAVKTALSKLQEEGLIAEIEIVDLSLQPESAEALQIRSVPWLQLGEFVLTGAQTPQQLRQWLDYARRDDGMAAYLKPLVANGQLNDAESMLKHSPQHLKALLSLLHTDDTPIQVRLGISAIFETLEGSETLQPLLPDLIGLSRDADHRLRSDACYFLGLTHHSSALPALQQRLDDEQDEVREIAAEAIDTIHRNATS